LLRRSAALLGTAYSAGKLAQHAILGLRSCPNERNNRTGNLATGGSPWRNHFLSSES